MSYQAEDYDYEESDLDDVTCKFCGKGGCFWREVGDRNVLFEFRRHGSIAEHVCKSRKDLSKKDIINAFEDLS